MSRYLVTGGAGFIGSHLVNSLIIAGHHVIVLDDLSTSSIDNIVNSNVEFICGTILDSDILEKLFSNIDGCFHLAAVASVQKSIDQWHYSHKVNLTGTINIFLHASKYHVPVVYASSAAVYGMINDLPLRENGQVNPLSPYAVDKYACELQAKVFGKIASLKSCGLRFFNVYGGKQPSNSDYSGVISIFKKQVKEGKKLTVFGDGNQTRDFIHISDVVNMCIKALDVTSSLALTLNVCTGKSCSINELIQIISKISGLTEIEYLPSQAGSINNSVGSNKLAQDILGYKAVYALENGLRDLFTTPIRYKN